MESTEKGLTLVVGIGVGGNVINKSNFVQFSYSSLLFADTTDNSKEWTSFFFFSIFTLVCFMRDFSFSLSCTECRWNQYCMRCQNSNDTLSATHYITHFEWGGEKCVCEKVGVNPSFRIAHSFLCRKITFIDIRDNGYPTECETLLLFVCLAISYHIQSTMSSSHECFLFFFFYRRKYDQTSNESECDDEVEQRNRKKKFAKLCRFQTHMNITNWLVICLQ